MKKFLLGLGVAAMAVMSTGCAYLPSGTDLSDVADNAKLSNVTTGDGTFENYTATGHYKATEVGIGVGIPYLGKFLELYPAQTNEDLLTETAKTAKEDGADAMINVKPASSLYTGIPFFFVGVYIDKNEGTGIDVR